MENSLKAILIAAGIVITLAIVTVGFLVLNSAKQPANDALKKIDNFGQQMQESEFTKYEGADKSGRDVLNAIEQFKNEPVGIQVKTNKDTGGKWYIHEVSGKKVNKSPTSNDISDAQDRFSDQYINPAGVFTGTVEKDDNGTIVAIIFDQN